MVLTNRGFFFACAALGLVVACSAGRPVSDYEPGTSAGGSPLGSGGSGAVPVPPEQELEGSFQAPVVSGRLVFSANPSSNRVAQIDVETLAVRVLDAGHAPTYLAPLPTGATEGGALVLNTRSRDASLFLLSNEEAGETRSLRVPVHEGANSWAIGASGRFAIAWTASGGSGSDGHQDITIIEPSERPDVMQLGVGYRPTAIHISEDETRAVVVSNPGLTVIELGEAATSGVLREYPLPMVDGARDVSVTPDGRLALVRLPGQGSLLILDLETGEEIAIPLPGELSDLDLSRDGTLAVGVIRPDGRDDGEASMGGADNLGSAGAASQDAQKSLVLTFPLERILSNPSQFDVVEVEDFVGNVSLTEDQRSILAFTNALANPRVWIIDAETRSQRAVDLRAPVKSVLPSPDGRHAVAVLSPPSGSASRGAVAFLPIDRPLPPRIEGTSSLVFHVVFSPEGDRALITTRGDSSTKSVALVAGFPTLSVQSFELPSLALAAFIVGPLEKGIVSQAHPEGRITFIDLPRGEVVTLTGYELGSKVVE